MRRPIAAVVDFERYPSASIDRLKSRFDVVAVYGDGLETLRLELERLQPEVLFCGIHLRVGRDLLDGCDHLSLVASPATGTTHLDLEYLHQRRTAVLTLGDCAGATDGVYATAEHTWLLVLALQRLLLASTSTVMQGRFRRDAMLGQSLHGRVLGVVGAGRLGGRVASYGVAFGMEVLAVDVVRSRSDRPAAGIRFLELHEMLSLADVVSIHVPLNSTTYRMIDEGQLRRMKSRATLVNTSRGEILNEHAVAASIVNGHLFGVGVDVLEGESEPGFDANHSPLVRAQRDGYNVIVTPHIGGWTEAAAAQTRAALVARVLEAT